MKEFSNIHDIPIYDFSLEIVVTDDIQKSRLTKNRTKHLGSHDPGKGCQGLCSMKGRDCAVFFLHETLSHSVIAHEIFHAAHNMLECVGHCFDTEGHEPFAYLDGYLTNLVYKDLKKWKLRVR